MLSIQKTLQAFLAITVSYAVIVVFASSSAHAATVTWDGGGVDTNFTTVENWVGDIAPVSGDDLVFDTDTFDFIGTLQNDMTAGTVFNSITTQGSEAETILIEGNDAVIGAVTAVQPIYLNLDLTLSASSQFSGSALINVGFSDGSSTFDLGSSILTTSSSAVTLDAVVTGTGGISHQSGSLVLSEANTYSGPTSISGGSIHIDNANALGTSSVDVSSGGQLRISTDAYNGSDMVIPNSMAISANSLSLSDNHFSPSGGAALTGTEVTFTGAVSLNSSVEVLANAWFDGMNINFDNLTLGGNELTLESGSVANLYINGVLQGGSSGGSGGETTYSDNQPTVDVVVNDTETAIITGTRQNITVNDGGVLKGDGTVADVTVNTGGTIAPGLSPGCLSTGNLTLAGTYEVEIDGTTVCTEYDQIQVTGTVSLTTPFLDFIYGSLPSVGDTFTIIDNDGTDAVTGSFSNPDGGGAWLEGVEANAGAVTYSISYVGGDGNDVVLTVEEVNGAAGGGTPTAPSTGFDLTNINPMAVIAAVGVAIVGLVSSLKLATVSNFKK